MQVEHSPHAETPPQRVQLVVGRPTWVTWALIGVNVLAYLWMMSRGAELTSVSGELALELGANHRASVVVDGEWWRLLASVFLHGGVLHLGFNMWALRVLGPFAEMYLGDVGFLVLYLICGVAASVVSIEWNPDGVSLGASGAIFALLGATVAFYVRHRREMPSALFRGQMRTILALIGVNVVLGISIPHVDNAAHFGGLVAGFLAGLSMSRRLLEPPRMTPRRWLGACASALLIVPLGWIAAMLGSIVHGPG